MHIVDVDVQITFLDKLALVICIWYWENNSKRFGQEDEQHTLDCFSKSAASISISAILKILQDNFIKLCLLMVRALKHKKWIQNKKYELKLEPQILTSRNGEL